MLSRGPAAAALLALTAACSEQGATNAGEAVSVSGRGAQIYAQNCVPCHQEDGTGVPAVYPGLHGSAAVLGDPLQLAQWVLTQTRPASIPAGRYSTQMPMFQWLNDEDAAALLTYIRSSFGNTATPVVAASVARARQG